MRPVLAHHDRGRYEIFCYHNHAAPDATTLELQALAEHWRDVAALDDAALERLILDDAIDVLVDLSGHTLGNRLPVFARRPAPVQATWIGYPQTTGLAAMDYRISDALLDPPGATEALGTEAILRLPECAVCFAPPEEAPRADAPPAVRSGRITFGSVNQYFKITGAVVRTWSRLLVAVPDAVLRMTLDQGERAEVAAEVQARFAAHGVAPDRIVVRGRSDLRGFFRELAELDLVLDPFPYNGGTTTYHCLWAGVPVVTLAGRTAIARCGAMILSHVGLAELVTADEDAYVSCATALARDTERLAELRRTLPVRYRASPLYAADRFTRALETAYDEMWRAFCAREAAPWPS
jgi:predicted O-linked N-acetylglucosamine transferase (SPINDLY family)